MDQKEIANKAKTVVVNRSTISTAGLVVMLLLVLKLTDNIDISWWWVFAPYWLPFALLFGFIAIFMIGAAIVGIIIVLWEEYENRKYRRK